MVSRFWWNAFRKCININKKASAEGADAGAGVGAASTEINILMTNDEAGAKMRMRFEHTGRWLATVECRPHPNHP